MTNQRLVLQIIVVVIGVIYSTRLFYIQVIDESYAIEAEGNSLKKIDVEPRRGVIYDRNGKKLAINKAVFDLQLTKKQLIIDDTLKFCKTFKITKEELDKVLLRIEKEKRYKTPVVFRKQLSYEDYALIQDQIIDYPGVNTKVRYLRDYPHHSLANTLGYIKEVTRDFLDNKDTLNEYKPRDLVGLSGLEKFYERQLRGSKGTQYVMKDVWQVVKGKYKNGTFDTLPISGEDLVCGIDLELQQYAEFLMLNKRGALVAIEPSTGEILALLSGPSYDPNELTGKGKQVTKRYVKLLRDPTRPLFNRSIMSRYPPGSTFKTVQALIGLQSGALDSTTTRFGCNKSLVKCHNHRSPLNVKESIQNSCNPFYYQAFRKMLKHNTDTSTYDVKISLDNWRKHVMSFGLGKKMGVDLTSESNGRVPNSRYYDKKFRKWTKGWKYGNIQSISIGQGEMGVSPLQLANIAAVIANRGWYYTPHVVKSIGRSGEPLPKYMEKHYTTVSKEYFDYIADGMQLVVDAGTARGAQVKGLTICGKTGTAQNPHGKDHSVFMAFAPKNNPKIAIAVYVENAGFGGTWAAPIASLVIEKYLNGEVSEATKYKETRAYTTSILGNTIKHVPMDKENSRPIQYIITQDTTKVN